MRKITEVPCHCANYECGWSGVTGNCDATADGDLFCPKCELYFVKIEYDEREQCNVPNVGTGQ